MFPWNGDAHYCFRQSGQSLSKYRSKDKIEEKACKPANRFHPTRLEEINDHLDFENFTVHTIPERIKKKGDLFKEVMDENVRKKNSQILRKELE